MRRLVPLAVAASAFSFSLALSLSFASTIPAEASPSDAGAKSLPACVQVSTQARYVPYGYNHLVGIRNGCSKTAACTVSTDVNPTTQNVEVAAGASVEVVTFMGSPARTFAARVSCRLR